MRKSVLAAVSAVAITVSLTSACSSSGSAGSANGPIKIATIGAFSGPNASTGDANTAVLAYFDYLNKHGGINGRKVEVAKGDDQYNPSLTPGIARKLQPQVVAFCGNNGTSENESIRSLLAQTKTPNIAPATGAQALFDPPTDTQYVAVPDYRGLTAGLIDYAVNTLHKKRIAVLYQDDAAGAPVHAAAESETKKLGVSLVAAESYTATATNLNSQMQKIKAAGPDFVDANGVSGAMALAVNAAKQIGLKTTWGNLFYGATPQFVKLTNSATVGNAYFATFVNAASDPSTKSAMKIMDAYDSSLGTTNTQAMQGWTLADACAAVLKKTASTGPVTSANIIKTLKDFTLNDTYVHNLHWDSSQHSGIADYQILKQNGSSFEPLTKFAAAPIFG